MVLDTVPGGVTRVFIVAEALRSLPGALTGPAPATNVPMAAVMLTAGVATAAGTPSGLLVVPCRLNSSGPDNHHLGSPIAPAASRRSTPWPATVASADPRTRLR
ncbi:hypothetical protein [Amycolatopsis sp. PS_44_ISF1]|uniref:hypothetical protein n=1 Tax=Amycolatopsis sp. PS_44_ISF1 TaxID=2974917 RepID=UPI0028E089F4|nr:hypothetical protein [Amycolatopsis sp. PS_44_ISF1]MDT8913537.1 hypothetical protein [Amycolatopsis sp. PS_44_ISF1]